VFAGANGVSASVLGANSAGAWPECRGLGIVHTDLALMEGLHGGPPTCDGRRFTDEVLEHTLGGRSIADVLDLTVGDPFRLQAGTGAAPSPTRSAQVPRPDGAGRSGNGSLTVSGASGRARAGRMAERPSSLAHSAAVP